MGHSYLKFNEEASKIYFLVVEEFQQKVKSLNRDGNENLFQLIRSQYAQILNGRLSQLASSITNDCQNPDLKNSLPGGLYQNISYFLNEFDKKANAYE